MSLYIYMALHILYRNITITKIYIHELDQSPDKGRLKRCIPHSTILPPSQELPAIQLEEEVISVQGSTLWAGHSPKNMYQALPTSGSIFEKTGNLTSYTSRQHPNHVQISGRSLSTHSDNNISLTESGLCTKLKRKARWIQALQ